MQDPGYTGDAVSVIKVVNANDYACLCGYLANDGMIHFASDKRSVRLNDDVIGTAIINYGLLLAKGVKL